MRRREPGRRGTLVHGRVLQQPGTVDYPDSVPLRPGHADPDGDRRSVRDGSRRIPVHVLRDVGRIAARRRCRRASQVRESSGDARADPQLAHSGRHQLRIARLRQHLRMGQAGRVHEHRARLPRGRLRGPAGRCTYAFPSPIGQIGDCEAVSCNGLATATVDSSPNGAGFPTHGSQYARVWASGPGGPGSGGSGNELYLRLRPMTLRWDFYNVEGPNSGYNDGMSIDIVAIDGTTINRPTRLRGHLLRAWDRVRRLVRKRWRRGWTLRPKPRHRERAAGRSLRPHQGLERRRQPLPQLRQHSTSTVLRISDSSRTGRRPSASRSPVARRSGATTSRSRRRT